MYVFFSLNLSFRYKKKTQCHLMYKKESNIFDEFFAMQHDSFETTGIKLF